MARQRQRKGGRPANPNLPRMTVQIDLALKRRVLIRAATDGVSFHKVLDAALRAYLKRGTR